VILVMIFVKIVKSPRKKAADGLWNSSLWYTAYFIIRIPFLIVWIVPKCKIREVKKRQRLRVESFSYLKIVPISRFFRTTTQKNV